MIVHVSIDKHRITFNPKHLWGNVWVMREFPYSTKIIVNEYSLNSPLRYKRAMFLLDNFKIDTQE